MSWNFSVHALTDFVGSVHETEWVLISVAVVVVRLVISSFVFYEELSGRELKPRDRPDGEDGEDGERVIDSSSGWLLGGVFFPIRWCSMSRLG